MSLSNYIAVDKEDLDEIPVTLTDIPSFVRVYFGDNSDGKYIPSEREADAHGLTAYRKYDVESARDIIYVENALTGEFVPIKVVDNKTDTFQDDSTKDVSDSDTVDGEENELMKIESTLDDETIDKEHVQYIAFLRIFFIFMQGILAGFAFASLYIQVVGSTDAELLFNYQSYAIEYRRLFYILTTFAVIGSADVLLSMPKMLARKSQHIGNKKGNSASEQSSNDNVMFIAFVSFGAFALCFMVTIVMSVADTYIGNSNGYTVDPSGTLTYPTTDIATPTVTTTWSEYALENDSTFKNSFTLWKSLSHTRFVTALIGFLGSCLIIWGNAVGSAEVQSELMFLKTKCNEVRNRVSKLCGENLGDLNIIELQSLMTTQKLGMERTQEALAAYGE